MKLSVSRFYRRQAVLRLTPPYPSKLRVCFLSVQYRAYAEVVCSKRYGPEDFEMGVKLPHDKIPLDFKPFPEDEYELFD